MVREEPSSGIEETLTPFIDEIGAAERVIGNNLASADFDCSFKDALVTDAEKAVPALVRLGSIKLTSKPYVAADAETAGPACHQH